jgi:hypothetical protein
VPIERVVPGDEVWAFDHRELCWSRRAVADAYVIHHEGTMATLSIQGETLRATGGHPFWVLRGEGLTDRPKPVKIAPYEEGGRLPGRWVLARDLRAGDEVVLRVGDTASIEEIRLDEVIETVYNFHVADLQNYAIGECGILVHNTNDPPKKIPKPGTSGKIGATDKPSWVKDRPNVGESGKDFAKRLLDDKYGAGKYEKGPKSEFNRIKKWADRHFMNPPEE